MREEMTMSLIGPLPRSHSPAWFVRSVSFTASPFRLLDLVAQLRRALVIFSLDRAGEFLPKLSKIDLPLHRHTTPAAPSRDFSDVVRVAFMRPLEQWRQVFLEKLVIVL